MTARHPLPPCLLETEEGRRLNGPAADPAWRRWGPYLSERQWGTVREDYSPDGTAWDSFPHDHARSRAYRWGEDGIAGWSDDQSLWCLGLALWNGRDPILKERMFGLTNAEGNHGEDVKELYYYSDGVPSHAYMRMRYLYPQAAFPYARLVEENRRRGPQEPELELIDTDVFNEASYFDVTVEYAKASPDDILMCITLRNPGPEAARLHVLPQLWARNTWSWTSGCARPLLRAEGNGVVAATHPLLPSRHLLCEGAPRLLFCENETNFRRLYGIDVPGPCKDGINDCVIGGDEAAVSAQPQGTKCAAWYVLDLGPGATAQIRLRFRPATPKAVDAFADFATILRARITETDEFYAALQRRIADPDARLVQRQAFAGMLWSKQFYYIDIPQWLDGDPVQPPPPPGRRQGRNADWRHLNNADVISMPDKWEYPWYAAWDLAFHCVTLAAIDPGFAKSQLVLLTREWYMHPNGGLPAYEWAFGDVNPPVHAWAAWRVYQMDQALTGTADRAFLERVFHKLLLNFTWWVNRKDPEGRNVFQGGFLGLDNIGIFDRSAPLPTGGCITQSDGTAWMAMYTLNLLRISIELAQQNPVYEDIATKFFEHFLGIAEAMANLSGNGVGLWDEQDQFFYDVLRLPGDRHVPLRIRSMVGLIPLFAVEVIDQAMLDRLPDFAHRLRWYLNYRPDLARLVSRWQEPGRGETHLLSLLRGHRMKALLRRMLDETEFLSPYGVRAVSRDHAEHPYTFEHDGNRFSVGYLPGESDSRLFGGNSNWRGPIWMPVNYMLVESLREFHRYYGENFRVECPVGSGQYLSLREVADELSRRLARLFLRGPDGRRPALGEAALLQQDPAFRDHLLFHEYFHGDTGRGVGAAHQTGWTGLIALLLHPRTEQHLCGFMLNERMLADVRA
ncbi:Glucosidase [Rhodovastum atsumiense]|uniref:Glucosidase n=1 Tax=Rhodovastum atsumiense TaxID=504468 RepID=A0A5M6J0P4_9PROT|nr:glucosidase [Rhodovastum atsumiense]KAA5614143.1 glucosidase [Rhodovastum atsumiense]CAH2598996.1 Glucosidase [Rhodovastum atsumiense]